MLLSSFPQYIYIYIYIYILLSKKKVEQEKKYFLSKENFLSTEKLWTKKMSICNYLKLESSESSESSKYNSTWINLNK